MIIFYLKSYKSLKIVGVRLEYLKPYTCKPTNDYRKNVLLIMLVNIKYIVMSTINYLQMTPILAKNNPSVDMPLTKYSS